MFILALSLATATVAGVSDYYGPERAKLDLVRPAPEYPRIYVRAELPDGSLGTFLVDTGADISVLNEGIATRIGLEVERGWGQVEGLSGTAAMHRAVIPEIRLGAMVVPEVEVAVGLPGLPDEVSFMPLDGLLGNNVWSRFVLEIDYPADLMVLHRPGSVKLPKQSAPMFFDGSHVYSPVQVIVESGTHTVIPKIDTGASELTVCAASGLIFRDAFTEGIETVRGIGASETLPPHRFLEMTRRIEVEAVELGGRRLARSSPARWIDFENARSATCGSGTRGLLGHYYLGGNRVFFDYREGVLSVTKSRRKRRSNNGHTLWYDHDVAHNGDGPDRGLVQAKYLLGMERDDDAVAALAAFVDTGSGTPEDQGEARVLLAAVHRHRGDLAAAWDALEPLSPGQLVDEHEIVATVNGLLFEERVDDALDLARAAVAARPDTGDAHVALADALLHHGQADAAREEVMTAARIEEYPDAHLLRRARIAMAMGDRYGSMAHIRKLLQLYPMGGTFLWFYALLIDDESDAATFRADMDAAVAKLHPHTRPFDFLVAAHHALGEQEEAEALMAEGIEAHCGSMADSPLRDNCMAWYWSLAGVQPEESLRRIQHALAATGDRSDFLDTKAMVHLARGEYVQAHDAAKAAARLSPDDVYMLWQAERIGALSAEESQP